MDQLTWHQVGMGSGVAPVSELSILAAAQGMRHRLRRVECGDEEPAVIYRGERDSLWMLHGPNSAKKMLTLLVEITLNQLF